jgi:AcrR family transcriptional regulator
MPKVVDIAERRAELAAAAAELIARAGVGAATLREVAAEAGWTTGALTHYFADKRELLLFTFRSSLAQRHAAREARDPSRPREALLGSLEGALPLDDARRRHWMVTVAFCAQAAGDEELSRAQRDAYRDFRDALADLVRRGAARTTDDAVALAERLIAVADGIAVQALFDPDSWPPEHQRATLHAAVEPMLAG